ncbi:hypothetical protein ACFU7Y_20195 [Kitasatospora sp. NPDC057542]|uniref:hypothetical protein n=1 Tax=Kitasatospora sp. NPDC057542 TaxID=3346162 RepID=UPI0036B28D26
MTRRSVPSDPTGRKATTNALTISPSARAHLEMILLLLATGDLSEAEVLRQTGMSPIDLDRRRDLYFADILREGYELEGLADGLPPEVKAAVREYEERLFAYCRQCVGKNIPPPTRRGGRPQRYCSNACRQKAYRERNRASG